MVAFWPRKRRAIGGAASEHLPPGWADIWDALPFAATLPESLRALHLERAKSILGEKRWIAGEAFALDEQMKCLVAAQAALLVLHMPGKPFPRVDTVRLEADVFASQESEVDEIGIVHEGEERAGEAWHDGVIVLSWEDVLDGVEVPGACFNVVYHEFAHALDAATSWFDGTPDLLGRVSRAEWAEVMDREYRALAKAARRNRPVLLDPYGATDASEFFAVASEAFFDSAAALREAHPQLYGVLSRYYQLDPASWEA